MATLPASPYVSDMDRVTVDRGYLNALVRRANLHVVDPASISISRVEHDNLLRTARDYQALRNALMLGGVDTNTLDILVAGSDNADIRKDSVVTEDPDYARPQPKAANFTPVKPDRIASNGSRRPYDNQPWRKISYATSVPEDAAYDEDVDDAADDYDHAAFGSASPPDHQTQHTLYFAGISEHTTYKDVLSVIKGGKVVSMILHKGSACVTLASGAAEFLAWSKPNDIYLQGKRIEIRWAVRQFKVERLLKKRIAEGATRNILIQNAVGKGLHEQQIKDDMEHVAGLIIVDVVYHNGDAYVYTNSIGYAGYARTCMRSRASYRGCKIHFFDDECDVPLPQRKITPSTPPVTKRKKSTSLLPNRFRLLNTEGTEADSDEENQDPKYEATEDDQTTDMQSHFGVRLDFLGEED